LVATFANVEDTDRNRASSKSVSSILDDSDCEDTVPGNVDDRMSAELGAYRSSKTEPMQFWKNKEPIYPNVVMQSQKLSVFARDSQLFSQQLADALDQLVTVSAMRAHIRYRWRNCQQT